MYTVAIPLLLPGWVGFDLGRSPGCLAAVVVTYYPSRMVEYPKPNQGAGAELPRCSKNVCVNKTSALYRTPFSNLKRADRLDRLGLPDHLPAGLRRLQHHLLALLDRHVVSRNVFNTNIHGSINTHLNTDEE